MSPQLVTVFGFPYNDSISKNIRALWSLYPPNLLAKALALLSGATSTPQDVGISWSSRAKCAPNDDECVVTIVCLNIDAQNSTLGNVILDKFLLAAHLLIYNCFTLKFP